MISPMESGILRASRESVISTLNGSDHFDVGASTVAKSKFNSPQERDRAYYSANRERILAKNRRWAKQNRQRASTPERRHAFWKWWLKSQYGITPEQFTRMMIQQQGRCAICSTAFGEGQGKAPYVDHCHENGTLRELLCSRCNVALGHADDSPERLQAMADYIRKHRTNPQPKTAQCT